ncbi:MAG: aldo/keto reductase [Planctomycetota bacterium]
MNRRDFMKGVVGAGAVGAVGAAAWSVQGQDGKGDPKGGEDVAPVGSIAGLDGDPIARRDLGKTGFRPTILGFGGYPISEVGEKQAIETIHAALQAGVNYFDTASTYGSHTSEKWLGKVLPKLDRSSFFLTTKTLQRRKNAAEKEIAESLRCLKVKPDLLQLHAVNDLKSLDAVMGKNGSFEAAVAAKEAGDVKYLGITGHTHPEALMKALDRYAFDTVLIPLGAPDHHLRSFEDVMAKANEKGAAVIAMKVLSGGHAVGKMPLEPLFQYSWNLPVSTAIIGMRSVDEVRTAVAAARAFKALTKERVEEILAQAKPLGNQQTLWWKRA